MREQSTVIMTADEFTSRSLPVREVREEGQGLSELSSSLLGSFQSLQNNQSSKKDKMMLYGIPFKVKIL